MQLPHITDSQRLPHGGSDVFYGWCEAYGDGKLFFYNNKQKEHERRFFGKKIDKILMCDEKF